MTVTDRAVKPLCATPRLSAPAWHGAGDDDVHYQGTGRLVNRLVELKKPFDLMIYPNRSHSISECQGTTAHVYRPIGRYFVTHLPPGPR